MSEKQSARWIEQVLDYMKRREQEKVADRQEVESWLH